MFERESLVRTLLLGGADVQLTLPVHRSMHDAASLTLGGFQTGETPLHLASTRGSLELARMLLIAGADLLALDAVSRKALQST